MKPERSNLVRLFFLIIALVTTTLAQSEEIITSYHSDIVIEENGDLLVTEKITVIAEGNKIKRGIYRDFPILIEDRRGRTKEVKFDILSIKRDGKADDWRREGFSNFVRLYIGNKDFFISRGPHVYEITYRTDRQLRFFDTHDELLWNVTGTQWDFAIERASASVFLPDAVAITGTTFFTGTYGSKEKYATASVASTGNSVTFRTTRPLGKRAGLTIGIKMAKGSFAPVPAGKEWAWFWRDYIGEVTGLVALFVVSFYYFLRWWQIGRDPPQGVVVPNWDTSNMISPALVNFIDDKGFGTYAWKAMSAAILNLAVKGYVVIDQLDDKPTITRTNKPNEGELPVGEAKLVDILDGRSSRSIRAAKSNGTSIKSMHSKFKSAISNEHRGAYYNYNWGSVAIGVILSVIGVIAIFAIGGVSGELIAIIIPLSIGTIIASLFTFKLATILRSHSGLLSKIVAVFFASFVVFGFVSSGIISLTLFLDNFTQPLLLICFAGILVVNLLFFFLLGAPTRLGREKMDVMEGLKTYLVLAEKDRMNMAGAPKMSPQHYENLLPYAVALGVEKPWSNAFQSWLLTAAAAAAGIGAASYSPGWYRGNSGGNIADSLGGMADNMASSFTSSLPTPKSSSSGFSGGGFSGGGGGGGGGGGW